MSRDFGFGIAGLALAAAYYLMAADVPESLLSDAVGPAGLPKIYAVVLAGLSMILLARSLPSAGRGLTPREAGREGPAGRNGPPYLRAAGLLAFGVVYIAIVPWAGYIISIAALIAGVTWYQGRVIGRQIVLVAIGGALLFWLLFVVLLGVPHPSGLWTS